MISCLRSVIYSPCKYNIKLPQCFSTERVFSSFSNASTFGSLKVPLEIADERKSSKVSSSTDRKCASVSKKTKSDYLRSENTNSTIFGELNKSDPHFKTELEAERNAPNDEDCITSQTCKALDIKRKRFHDYAVEIMQLSRQRKTKEAIELFESLEGLGVTYQKQPYLYSKIISACGKRGYTKKAFQIYAKMRQNGVKPTPAILTGLFNSCAECPFPDYGLEKARNLHLKMQEEGWQGSAITYHAMIKAYGRCGDLASAFLLVDEMKRARHAITAETFAFLQQACISDKEAGFSNAISVLRKMRAMKIKPTVHNYNLLLRAVRDCGIGPPEVASKLLLEWSDSYHLPKSSNLKRLPSNVEINSEKLCSSTKALSTELNKSNDLVSSNSIEQVTQSTQMQEVIFDLLAPRPIGTTILALGEIKTSDDKLALLGGPNRIIKKLLNLREKPNIQTATLLLECQNSSTNAELALLKLFKETGLQLDIDFFNVLIKKRCSRWDYTGAREVLNLIAEHGLYMDIATFGTLAMSCKKRSDSTSLLKDMDKSGFTPNIKILGALMKNAFLEMDFGWMHELMRELVRYDVKPCKMFLDQLEEAWNDANRAVVFLEQGKTVPAWAETKNFQREFKHFCLDYKKWLKSVKIDLPQHPWKQFQPNKTIKDVS